MSCDDLAKGLFYVVCENHRELQKCLFVDPVFGQFRTVHADFSSVDFGAVFGPLGAPMSFALNAVYTDVSVR